MLMTMLRVGMRSWRGRGRWLAPRRRAVLNGHARRMRPCRTGRSRTSAASGQSAEGAKIDGEFASVDSVRHGHCGGSAHIEWLDRGCGGGGSRRKCVVRSVFGGERRGEEIRQLDDVGGAISEDRLELQDKSALADDGGQA